MGARLGSAVLPAVLPMWMLHTGALPGAGPLPAPSPTHPSTGRNHRPKVPSSRASRDEESSYWLTGLRSDKCTDSPGTFLHIPGPCPSPSGSFTHRRSAAHRGQLCPQWATKTQAQATSTGHPHQTNTAQVPSHHSQKGHSQNL